MGDEIYHKLAKVLDTLPNGFPSSESGVEIKILKKIFDPEQAELFCELKLTFETPEQIAERTGRPLEGLEEPALGGGDRGRLAVLRGHQGKRDRDPRHDPGDRSALGRTREPSRTRR